MSKLLYVISSPRGEQSESTKIADEFLGAYLGARPGLDVQRLNLWDDQLPIYGGRGAAAKMTVFSGQTPVGDEAAAWADVERVFAPFKAADEYLFSVPMWNAGVPWVLKHLIDTITQPGLVFGFDPAHGYTRSWTISARWWSTPAVCTLPELRSSSAWTSTRSFSTTGSGSSASTTSSRFASSRRS
ncbi:MAG: NAD(P)H-dependent oxidoreductase [Solirubrobacterales bacterium]|nr:NAD(P)H-dependent oxidoreductase [Solirubrobacterales bacterium]